MFAMVGSVVTLTFICQCKASVRAVRTRAYAQIVLVYSM